MIDPQPCHVIEDHVKVYLTADDEGRWRIDSTTVDGYALDGLENGPDDSQCECERHDDPAVAAEHDAALQRVIDHDSGNGIDAEELLRMLAYELGYHLTLCPHEEEN